ncbi:Response regulator receiver domain [Geoglobus ahangari]|uniref:Response regulator receiver domain n=1 Tax=Geoglobus ahangari TaxID=113653 RepID=A0A0F7IC68_9EURY|nr:response regulator [Geoglobus ahangari]AKG90820.1 Response regulator receiver domain [Geoglobus ahangari]
MSRYKILVVEDDPAVLDVVKLMLNGNNCQVLTARNGREAVDLYRFAKPDIVLMDIEMPVMDGIEATKEILRLDPNAKIIGVTAFSKTKGKDLIAAGALEMIEKPFTRRKLLAAIKKYLEC